MFARYLTRGVKAGIVAGLVAAVFVALIANPLVAVAEELGHDGHAIGADDHAVADEHEAAGDGSGGHHDAAGASDGGESAMSAATTNTVSILSGLLWGVLLGGLVFGIGYFFLEPIIPGTGATKQALLGVGGFVTVSGAPWLVLPPQPPGVESTLPTDIQMLGYAGMMVAGALVCLCSALTYDRLERDYGKRIAGVVAVVPFSLLLIPVVLVPETTGASAIPGELAAGLLGTVVFGQLLLWSVLAATQYHLEQRSERGVDEEFLTGGSESAVTAD